MCDEVMKRPFYASEDPSMERPHQGGLFIIMPDGFEIGLLVRRQPHRDAERVQHGQQLFRIYGSRGARLQPVYETPRNAGGVGELLLRHPELVSSPSHDLADHARYLYYCALLHRVLRVLILEHPSMYQFWNIIACTSTEI